MRGFCGCAPFGSFPAMLKRYATALPVLAMLCLPPAVHAQSTRTAGAIEAGLILRRLDGVKRVLMIAAHPDDEDTALLTALARGMGVDAMYFSLTRGEGGQNLIGPELGEGLGIIRTGELLAARRLDGAEQRFSRAYDFGYSKTAGETFRQWSRQQLLADLVWTIRTFRPQIIVSVFGGTPRDGHGQHQAAGLLAREAWEAAGDASRFPEQLEAGARPWTPLKLYRRTLFDPAAATLTIPTGRLDPLLGRSYFQVAMEGRSQHRSQDFGSAQSPGPRTTTLALVEARVPAAPAAPLFAGIDTTLAGSAGPLAPASRRALEAYRAALGAARRALNAANPEAAFGPLAEARRELAALETGLPAGAREALGLEGRRELLDRAILAAGGIRVEFRSRDEVLVPGQDVVVEIRVWSGRDATVEVDPPRIETPDGWTVRAIGPGEPVPPDDTGAFGRFFRTEEPVASAGAAGRVSPDGLLVWRFRVSLPADARTTSPYYLERPRDGALYRWPERTDLWTRPFQPPILHGSLSLRITAGGVATRTTARGPVRYRGVDKASGEFWRPVQVAPRVSIAPPATTLVWPLGDTLPRAIDYRLLGRDPAGFRGFVALQPPAGWRVDPARRDIELGGEGVEATASFTLTPPVDGVAGEVEVPAVLSAGERREVGRTASVIDYPHIEPRLVVSDASVRIVRFPVRVADRRVGYVMGSGDQGPEAIRQLGLDVELIEADDWAPERLDRFDTIVLGVRAYEVRNDLVAANSRLLEWTRRGGTLIVQYNKFEFNEGDYAPYPLRIGQPQARVTDETAPVRILDDAAAVFRWPNAIGPTDFDGWVQERGLYFPTEWDDAYVPLLGMADPGESELEGALLVAPYGRGIYVHTSLAFFRQLPAGVPGAYRLFANLLSLDAGRWQKPGGTF